MIWKIKSAFKGLIGRFRAFSNWHSFYLNYFGPEGEEVVYSTRSGLKLRARAKTDDRFILSEVYGFEIYTKNLGIGDEDVVVDIGGQAGYFTCYAAGKTIGTVYSFEPSSDNFELLTRNVEENRLENVEKYNKAVAGETGERELGLSYKTGAHGLNRESGEVEKVETISFDDLIELTGYVDFMKVDCEGAEHEILENASQESLGKVKKIAMEVHGDQENIVELLEEAGFRVDYERDTESLGFIWARK